MKTLLMTFVITALFCPQQGNSIYEPLFPAKNFLSGSETVPSYLTASHDESKLSVAIRIRPLDPKADEMKVLHAQKIASQLFEMVEKNNLIIAGKSEEQLRDEVTTLAKEKFGVDQHWHKKIVRSGVNTMSIYPDNPPNRILQNDDILFIDFGIVVDGWESDYAKTYVIGNDPGKIKLKNDVEKAWYETQAWYKEQTMLKSSTLFQFVVDKANQYGWKFGGEIAGHIVGKYPHEQPLDPKSLELDVHPTNHNDIFLLDANGKKRHWILEIHFIDEKNKIGGYMEQLL
jgi:hypothetical protein